MKAHVESIRDYNSNLLINLFRQRRHNVKLNIQEVADYGELEELLFDALDKSMFLKRCINTQKGGTNTKFWGQTFPVLGYSFEASIFQEGSNAKINLNMPEYLISQVMNYMRNNIDADEEYINLINEYSYPTDVSFNFAAMY